MASSVSSERAFSLAGITICKRHNRLDADIVEALQGLKSLIRQDLMVRDVPGLSITDEELKLDHADKQPVNQDSTAIEVVDASNDFSWDSWEGPEGASDVGDDVQVVEYEVGGNDTEVDIE
jgi:hypothetical protein